MPADDDSVSLLWSEFVADRQSAARSSVLLPVDEYSRRYAVMHQKYVLTVEPLASHPVTFTMTTHSKG